MKGSYRNRCLITGPNGIIRLSIPLVKGKHQKTPIKDVNISFVEDWKHVHWQSIQSSYGRSPYFSFYEDELKEIFFTKESKLFKWNDQLFRWVVEQLNLKLDIHFSTDFIEHSNDDIDFRNQILPKRRNLGLTPYEQVFSDRFPFQPDLSILDLLFSKGPQAKDYL